MQVPKLTEEFEQALLKDEQAALEALKAGVERGERDALYNMGVCYMNGIQCETDFKKALSFFLRAAELGHIEAQLQAVI